MIKKDKKFQLIDKKFKENKKKYIIQCLVAAGVMAIILVFLSALFNSVIIASFGSTCFIVFAMPYKHTSDNRVIIGGYIVGILTGVVMLTILSLLTPTVDVTWLVNLFGAISIAVAIFVMVVTNTEHPPAAGVALGIVLKGIEPLGVVVLAIAIVLLVLTKFLFKKWMIDLL